MGKPRNKSKNGKNKKQSNSQMAQSNVQDEQLQQHDSSAAAALNKTKYTIDNLLERVQGYVENFEYHMAVKFCERAYEMDPNNTQVLETFGNVCAEMGDVESAKQHFHKAAELQPFIGHVKYLYLGQLSEGLEAVQHYLRAVELLKDNLTISNADPVEVIKRNISSVYCSLAELYMTDLCMTEDAERECGKYSQLAIDSDQQNVEAYVNMANYLLNCSKMEGANAICQQAFNLWKSYTEANKDNEDVIPELMSYQIRLTLTKLLIEVESFDKAYNVIEQLINEDEDDVTLWYYLGLAKSLEKKESPKYYLDKALHLYKKTHCDDTEMLEHVNQLLQDCGEASDDEEDDDYETNNVLTQNGMDTT